MSYLLLSLVALAAGPLLLGGRRRGSHLAGAIDGFVVTSIPLLVFFQFVPSAIEARAVGLLLILAAGVALPAAIERLTSIAGTGVHRWGLLLGIVGLAVHAFIDGSALAIADRLGGAWGFPLAVILHRLPVGVSVWWLVSGAVGPRGALLAVAAIMAATMVGYTAGASATRLMALDPWLTLFQAGVAGSLVHVAVHRTPGRTERGRSGAEAVGAAVAVAVVIGSELSGHGGMGVAGSFLADGR